MLVFFVALPWLVPLPRLDAHDVLVVAWLGVFQVGCAYALLSRGVSHMRAFDASILMLIEPVLNPIWAWLVHHETPGPWSLAGGAVILGTTAIRAWYNPRP